MARKARAEETGATTPSRKSQRVGAAAAAAALVTPSHTPTSNGHRAKRKRQGPEPQYADRFSEEEEAAKPPTAPELARPSKRSKTPKHVKAEQVKVEEDEQTREDSAGEAKAKAKSAAVQVNGNNDSAKDAPAPQKRKRKTKEEKAAEAMPLAARSSACKLHIGAHISAAGGVHNAVTNAVHIGGNAFALFLKSQRKWANPPLAPDATRQFKALCAEHRYDAEAHVVPHGSYLVNLAAKEPEKAAQAYDSFLEDLQRAEALGITLYNFHPGNTNGEPRPAAIARIAARLNAAHKATSSVVTLLENMAAAPTGNTIGGAFEDLQAVIALVHDKARVGVCLDTCHAFAAGYDLRSPAAFADTLAAFDRTVGLKYLRAVHVNDSKAPLASHRDLHQNIGTGFLGLRAFHNLVNAPCMVGLPLVLETPIDKLDENGKTVQDKSVWAREIKMLESLVGMSVDSDEFRKLEAELADKGMAERAKYQAQFDKKLQERSKKAGKGKGKGKKGVEEDCESRGSSPELDSE